MKEAAEALGDGGHGAAVNNAASAANKGSRVNKPSHAPSPCGPTDVGRQVGAFKKPQPDSNAAAEINPRNTSLCCEDEKEAGRRGEEKASVRRREASEQFNFRRQRYLISPFTKKPRVAASTL